MRPLLSLVLGGNIIVVLVAPFVLGVLLATPGGVRRIEVWLGLALVIAMAALVPAHARRLLQPNLRAPVEWYEDPPTLLYYVACLVMLPIMIDRPSATVWMLIAGGGWAVLARRAQPATTAAPERRCGNCNFDVRGNQRETCPECGFVDLVLGHYRGRWVLVRFAIDSEVGGSLIIGLQAPGIERMHDHLRIPAGPGAVWDKPQQTMWLLNIPDDLTCFHQLREGNMHVLPAWYLDETGKGVIAAYAPGPNADGSDPYYEGWQVNPNDLQMTVHASVVADNRAAIGRG